MQKSKNKSVVLTAIFSVIACAVIIGLLKKNKREHYVNISHAPVSNDIQTTVSDNASIFMFANNKCSPECCNQSNFSCSGGCVCLSENQKYALRTRGNNASIYTD